MTRIIVIIGDTISLVFVSLGLYMSNNPDFHMRDSYAMLGGLGLGGLFLLLSTIVSNQLQLLELMKKEKL